MCRAEGTKVIASRRLPLRIVGGVEWGRRPGDARVWKGHCAGEEIGILSPDFPNLPSGITASFSPSSVTGAGSSQLKITADGTVAAGKDSLTVTGTSGGVTETAAVAFVAYAAPVPAFTIGAAPNALTVNSGSSGTVTLTLTSQNGFNSPVTLACSQLPAGVTCSFNPGSLTPTANTGSTAQLTISAGGQAANTPPLQRIFSGATLALAFCLFGSKKRRGLQKYALLALACLSLCLATACSRGGGGTGGGGSPPVTTVIKVTATSGNSVETSPISLTVN